MTNSIKYLFYNSKKNERKVEVDGASLCFGGSGALRWVVAACLLLQQQDTRTLHDQPTTTQYIGTLLLMFYD